MKWEIVWFMWYKADMCLMQKFTWSTKFERNARDSLKNHLFRYMKTNNILLIFLKMCGACEFYWLSFTFKRADSERRERNQSA